MSTVLADKNSIVFSAQGIVHCGVLSENKYNLIVINPFEYNNRVILNNICNQIKNFYSKGLIDCEKLIVRLNCQDSGRINEFKPLYELLNNIGYRKIEFINNNLHYNPIIENMLKNNKASLCLKLTYGEKLDSTSIRNLRTYLEQAMDKEDINVHCVIKDINSVNNSGIQDFVKSMYKLGINKIGLRLDSKYINPNSTCTLPNDLNRMFINFFKTAKKYSFFIDVKNKQQNEFLKNLCKIHKYKKRQ